MTTGALATEPASAVPRPRWRRALGQGASLIGSALDGFVYAFTGAYLVTTAISGLANFYGFGPFGDVVLPLLVTSAGLLVVAGIVGGLIVGIRRLGRALDRRLAGRGMSPRRRAVITAPLRAVGALPALTIGLTAGVLVLAFVLRPMGPGGIIAPVGVLTPLLFVAGFVGFLAGLARGALHRTPEVRPRIGRRVLAATASGIAVVLVAVVGWAVLEPGTSDYLVPADAAFDGTQAAAIPAGLDDPGQPGPYAVRTLSYGSGTDRHRPAFGADASILTRTVDASAVLPRLGGGNDELRAWYWGFDRDALPLNGLVWYPDGAGPFPLVVIVHGNHAMGQASEPGYAYLGEHLASRGFIVSSIDEDFLNGSWAGDWGGREQPLRAWLLRLHVDLFRQWDADPASPFYDHVDLDRVALIGHSRGGEAASIAASWNERDTAPLGLDPWPEGIRVRSVVSIAPSDGQYLNDASLDLVDVDFLTLTGGHDMDATAWSGIRQYHRTTVADDGFKAALWVYRGNHGQFNTVWGSSDQGPFGRAILNLAPLLSASDQEQVAKVAIGAFLEASLHDRDGYRGLFRRPMVGREWLPDDIYLVRSDEGGEVSLVDGTTPNLVAPGVKTATDRLAGANVIDLPLRSLQLVQDAKTVSIRWDAGVGQASWGLTGIASGAAVPSADTELRFALADATLADQAERPPLDPRVEVATTDGVAVALPLSSWGELPPPLPAVLAKQPLLADVAGIGLNLASPVERVLQSYVVPLSVFVEADPGFRPERLDSVTFRFDRGVAGSAYIGEVALRAP